MIILHKHAKCGDTGYFHLQLSDRMVIASRQTLLEFSQDLRYLKVLHEVFNEFYLDTYIKPYRG